jgi:hypothetical protein
LLSASPAAETVAAPLTLITPSAVEVESEMVEVGDCVLIAYNDDTSRQHTIRISATEHNPDMEIIRVGHPMAEALLGAEIDEELEIPAGGGMRTVTVVGIEKDASKLQVQESATHAPVDGAVAEESKSADDTGLLSTEHEAIASSVSESPVVSTEEPERPIQAQDFAPKEETGKAEEALPARSESREPAPHVDHSHSTQPYQAWNRHPLPDPRGEPLYKIADRLVEIIEAEGPVLLHRAFHLYAAAVGIKRIGNQLRSIFLRVAGIALKSGRVEAEERGDGKNLKLESIVRSAGNPPVVLRKRGPRTFEEIPPSEVAQMMRSLVRTHPSVDDETLYRQVLDFYDLKRLTSNVRNVLSKILLEIRREHSNG